MYSKLIKCSKLVHFIGFIPSISRNLSLFSLLLKQLIEKKIIFEPLKTLKY